MTLVTPRAWWLRWKTEALKELDVSEALGREEISVRGIDN